MAMTARDRLRLLIDDPLPTDGTQPMFTDLVLDDILSEAGGDPERAAADAWTMKAAQYAGMVDVVEGNAARAMSDLHDHALAMIKTFQKSSGGPTEGRARVGRIRRSKR